jgi:hypothetical protein
MQRLRLILVFILVTIVTFMLFVAIDRLMVPILSLETQQHLGDPPARRSSEMLAAMVWLMLLE